MPKIALVLALLTAVSTAAEFSNRDFPDNPFRDKDDFRPVRASDLFLASREAGLTQSPRRAELRFRLYDEKNRSLPAAGTNLRFVLLKEGREFPLAAGTVFAGDFHIASLPLPKVNASGWADLDIRIATGTSLRMQNAVYYRKLELSVIFIVDQSGSMNENDPKGLRTLSILESLRDETLRTGIREVALVSFSDGASLVLPFTSATNAAAIQTAFAAKPASGQTDIPTALKTAIDHVNAKRPPGKVIAILLTDGASTTPLRSEHLLFQKAGVPLYTIGLRGNDKTEYDETLLKKIASDTGGVFSSGRQMDLKSVYQKALFHGLRESESVFLFPLPDELFESEALSVEYDSLAAPEPSFRAATNTGLLDTLETLADGVHRKTLFAPLAPGLHSVSFEWSFPDGRKILKTRLVNVKGRQNLFRLGERPAFRKIEADSLLAISTTLENLTMEAALFDIHFLPLTGDGGKSLGADSFHAEENPIFLNALGAKTIQLNLRLGAVPPGLYAGNLILFRNGRPFLANFSAEVEAASYRGPAVTPEKNGFLKRVMSFVSSGIFLGTFVALLAWVLVWGMVHSLASRIFKS